MAAHPGLLGNTIASNRAAAFAKKGYLGTLDVLEDLIDLGFALEDIVDLRIEVFNKVKGHVGALVLHDFGDGLELAVFQSASDPINPKKTKALFYNDEGPNITALYNYDGSSNWAFFGLITDYSFAD